MKAIILLIGFVFALCAADPYAPLRLYDGSWDVRLAGKPADKLTNRCALIGRYYACEQTVNGKVGALVVFLPKEQPGEYWTNPLTTEARSNGRGDLSIQGNRWVYSSKNTEGEKTTFYRTVNVFTGADQIHFEVAESPDGKTWTVTMSGDETRASAVAK